MNFSKFRKVCRPVRILLGLSLIIAGVYTSNSFLYLGILPLIAGIVNFCPICIITKKCAI